MLNVTYSSKFKKDFKTCIKRHCKMDLLQQAIDTLRVPEKLPEKNKDHMLSGNFSSYRECHIEPDWLLIYQQTDTELFLYRTGTHSDLFSK